MLCYVYAKITVFCVRRNMLSLQRDVLLSSLSFDAQICAISDKAHCAVSKSIPRYRCHSVETIDVCNNSRDPGVERKSS